MTSRTRRRARSAPRTFSLAVLLAAIAILEGRAPPSRAAPEPARSQTAALAQSGAIAPADAWTAEGGCVSHSAASAARPLRGPLERVWTYVGKGEIEEEPRVARGRVFLSQRDADGIRWLVTLRLSDGHVLHRTRFEAVRPLSVAVEGDRVVVRTKTAVVGYTVSDVSLRKRWAVETRDASAPLLLGGSVWVRSDAEMIRVVGEKVVARATPRTGVLVDVDPALRDAMVYAVSQDAEGNRTLATFDAAHLAPRWERFIGSTKERAGLRSGLVRVGPRAAAVWHEVPLRMGKGQADLSWLDLGPHGPAEDAGALEAGRLRIAFGPDATVGVRPSVSGPTLTHQPISTTDGTFRVLASEALHPEWLSDTLPPPVALGSVVYHGSAAYDAETGDVLRFAGATSIGPAIPVGERVLLQEGPGTLCAWREARPAPRKDAGLTPAAPAGAEASAPIALPNVVVVLRDGDHLRGDFALSPGADVLSRPGKKPKDERRWSLAEVDAVLSADAPRRLHYAADVEAALRGVATVVRTERAALLLAAARDAIAAGARELAGEWLDEAEEGGAPGADVDTLRRRLTPTGWGAPKPLDAKRADAARARAASSPPAADVIAEIAAGLPDTAPRSLSYGLVRAVLDLRPDHPQAVALVRSRVPAGIVPTEPFHASDWLAFLDALAQTPIALVDAPRNDQHEKDLTWRQKQYGIARSTWRKDLVALESGPLLVVTPVESPGSIARCLSMGRLVTSFLEEAFRGQGRPRDDMLPLTHFLYGSQAEYAAQSTKKLGGTQREAAMRGLDRFAGHYSPDDEISRMFLPGERRDFEEVMGTYAHELTHHWVHLRCPLFDEREAQRGGAATGGYFVVEGIAEMVSELRYDLQARTAEPFDPRANSLDVVASAPAGALLPWDAVLTMPHLLFSRLSAEASVMIPTRWRLGAYRLYGPMQLFYAQSAAAAHWAWNADGGSRRAGFLAFLADHYTGRVGPDTFVERFGLPPAEVGRRVAAWAKDVAK